MGTKTRIDRKTYEEYQEDPAAFFKKQEEKSETKTGKDYWKDRRELFLSEESQNGIGEILSRQETDLINARKFSEALREGPSKMEKFVWRLKDLRKTTTSLFPKLKEYTPWITYSAVAGVLALNFIYCIKYGLGTQGLFTFLITGIGILLMMYFLWGENKTSWHTAIASMLVVINLLLTQVTSLVPNPNATAPHVMRSIITEDFGVVMHEETGEVTRVIVNESSRWFIPAFQWNETIEWYGKNHGTQYYPTSLNVDLGDVSITAIPRFTLTAKPGDILQNLPSSVELFNDVESQSRSKLASLLEESESDIATREGLMQIKSLIEDIENSIYQIEISDLTVVARRDDGARTIISYPADEIE